MEHGGIITTRDIFGLRRGTVTQCLCVNVCLFIVVVDVVFFLLSFKQKVVLCVHMERLFMSLSVRFVFNVIIFIIIYDVSVFVHVRQTCVSPRTMHEVVFTTLFMHKRSES
jgi:hypothetical protein